MKGLVGVILSIALTALCWGTYGPVLQWGSQAMDHSRLRPFLCVGIAYFVIAVVVPLAMLIFHDEKGSFTFKGTLWSLVSGVATAIGALGIIMALGAGGSPVYVMPLVFGCAPVVNTFFSMATNKALRAVGPFFVAGLILVAVGAVCVLVFKPTDVLVAANHATTAVAHPTKTGPAVTNLPIVTMWIAITAVCWGIYGPILHWGQVAMGQSRLRPFMCVGIAYFLIAVLIPLGLLQTAGEVGQWSSSGSMWSLLAGAAGAIGSLGIILAFNAGGRPIYVMPLVFGCAPVVNTLVAVSTMHNPTVSPVFYAGLMMVAAGAVTVLIFAPQPGKPHAQNAAQAPAAAKA